MSRGRKLVACWLGSKLLTKPLYFDRAPFQWKSPLACLQATIRSLCFLRSLKPKGTLFLWSQKIAESRNIRIYIISFSDSCDCDFVICIHSFIQLFICCILFSNCSQAVAREKLDKIREENQSKTRKDYEMTISELKVGPLSRTNYFGFDCWATNAKALKKLRQENEGTGSFIYGGYFRQISLQLLNELIALPSW
mgnify:CR=1 FL=1